MMSYVKTIVAVVFAALTAVYSAISDGTLTGSEKVQVLIAITTALSVYLAPNIITFPFTKVLFAALLAALNLATAAVTDSRISTSEWINIAIAFVGVFFVWFFPNPRNQLVHGPDETV